MSQSQTMRKCCRDISAGFGSIQWEKNDHQEAPGLHMNIINETVKERSLWIWLAAIMKGDKVKSHHKGVYSTFGRRILSDNPRWRSPNNQVPNWHEISCSHNFSSILSPPALRSWQSWNRQGADCGRISPFADAGICCMQGSANRGRQPLDSNRRRTQAAWKAAATPSSRR